MMRTSMMRVVSSSSQGLIGRPGVLVMSRRFSSSSSPAEEKIDTPPFETLVKLDKIIQNPIPPEYFKATTPPPSSSWQKAEEGFEGPKVPHVDHVDEIPEIDSVTLKDYSNQDEFFGSLLKPVPREFEDAYKRGPSSSWQNPKSDDS